MNRSYMTGSRILIGFTLLLQAACSPAPVAQDRFTEPDRFYDLLEANVRNSGDFEIIVDIDHARLAAQADSHMPPAHVLIWSDPRLDAAILADNPLAAIDLPLRALAYEDPETGKAAVIANRYDFLAGRHDLPDNPALRDRYATAIAKAMQGIGNDTIRQFASDEMPEPGLVTLKSPHDFATTEGLIMRVIESQPDTVYFATVDFAERALAQDVQLSPLRLILFGGPGPGGQAMREAPTLGLDAFCQKLLVWEDANGQVRVTFNDLLTLAERQQAAINLPLRVINRRVKKTFSVALRE